MVSKTALSQFTNLPTLPPLIRQMAQTAPEDFRTAVVLCSLPILGTLGSKLRAKYLDGRLHTPSFQVALEAPQASGKSFMSSLAQQLLAPIMKRDKEERQREKEYNDRVAEMKEMRIRLSNEEKLELLDEKPNGIIRIVPATISITKLLQRMEKARGLHLFALAEEIDTVNKTFKRSFSSYGDMLRVAFDNGLYGQDYANNISYSGIVNMYYNTLFSGTPNAVRRFYSDVENGMVSRVCFVTLPDQFGRPMPTWSPLTENSRLEVEKLIECLDRISVVDNLVQPDHVMNLDFLNHAMEQWLKAQQQEAVHTDDRSRDIFCRRAAVVGFRAGMLAWFLYGENDTRTIRENTADFACWVASQMLAQHLMRYQISGNGGYIAYWEKVYDLLGDEFTRDEVQEALVATSTSTSPKMVLYRWRVLNYIETIDEDRTASGRLQSSKFKKLIARPAV